MSASLAIVSNRLPENQGDEPLSNRIKRLQDEAKAMARDHVAVLEQGMAEVCQTAMEIADGGDAYPVGAREMARQLATDIEARLTSLEAIMTRNGMRHVTH